MDTYCAEVCKLEAHFKSLEFHHIHREHNVAADVLSKLNSKRAQVPASMFIQDLRKPSIKILDPNQADSNAQPQADLASTDVLIIQVEEDWQAPFIAFITDNMSPEDKAEHKKLARRSTNYIVISKELYRKATSTGILMKCILRNEGIKLLHEIHSGSCGNHATLGS
ncbi:uncharacterized protein LOC105914923 [Setaria italica]|uniref:uncharacterized protein LOC105914923 n=1 Tax=Setaria italica TaxID=4555 RepID=UPI000645F413|nr:uncharacterized protein LOC105914923 [Setaria italica]